MHIWKKKIRIQTAKKKRSNHNWTIVPKQINNCRPLNKDGQTKVFKLRIQKGKKENIIWSV